MTRSTRNGRATIRSGRVAPSVRAPFPRAEAETLLVEYAQMMHGRVTGAGGPDFDWRPHVAAFFAGLDGVLPPTGSYLLARDATGRPVGTGALRRVSDDTGEMKTLMSAPRPGAPGWAAHWCWRAWPRPAPWACAGGSRTPSR